VKIAGTLALCVAIAAISPRSPAADPPPAGIRAEIQIGLCSPTEQIVKTLHLRPRGAVTQVWLFDDAALTLFARGLRLRLRVADGRSELTLKVADQDCARLDPAVVASGEGKCEHDIHGSRMEAAVSLVRRLDPKSSDDLLAGRLSPAQALSPAQIGYLRDVVGYWPLASDLRALGPTQLETYRAAGKPYDVDISELPAGTRYVEISRKVPVADIAHARAALEADLARAVVEMCADQSAQAVNKLRALSR